jgi:hypothetical protein
MRANRYGSRGLMEDDGSEYDFHVFTSLKTGMVRPLPQRSHCLSVLI